MGDELSHTEKLVAATRAATISSRSALGSPEQGFGGEAPIVSGASSSAPNTRTTEARCIARPCRMRSAMTGEPRSAISAARRTGATRA